MPQLVKFLANSLGCPTIGRVLDLARQPLPLLMGELCFGGPSPHSVVPLPCGTLTLSPMTCRERRKELGHGLADRALDTWLLLLPEG